MIAIAADRNDERQRPAERRIDPDHRDFLAPNQLNERSVVECTTKDADFAGAAAPVDSADRSLLRLGSEVNAERRRKVDSLM